MWFLRLVFFIIPFFLDAGIEDHFKKAENKENHHFIKNVDFIYMINLDQRAEKFEPSRKALEEYGIYPYRFSAIYGWALSLEVINQLGVVFTDRMRKHQIATYYPLDGDGSRDDTVVTETIGRCYFARGLNKGAIGCYLSHLSVLQDAYDSGYETVWIMEDDIEIIQNPHIVSSLIKRLDKKVGKKKWDIFFTDKNAKNKKGEYVKCIGFGKRPNFVPKNQIRFFKTNNLDSTFKKIGARYGTYSYIIRRAGIKKILDFVKKYKMYHPIDVDMFILNNLNIYAVKDDIVSTRPTAISDNQG